jgi:hypothetical protein
MGRGKKKKKIYISRKEIQAEYSQDSTPGFMGKIYKQCGN